MTTSSINKAYAVALGLLLVGAGCAQNAAPQAAQPSAPASGAPVAPAERQDAAQARQDEAAQGTDAAMARQDEAQAKQDEVMGGKDETVAGDAREINVVARQFSFEPAEIRVKKGERVRLIVASQDVTHGLAIPTFGVNLTIDPGATATAEFVADKTGSFPFFCNVFCGGGHGGMRGTLIVE